MRLCFNASFYLLLILSFLLTFADYRMSVKSFSSQVSSGPCYFNVCAVCNVLSYC